MPDARERGGGYVKTRYEYLHFEKVADKPKTSVWSCRTNRNNDELGTIKWYGPWRQYCYFPTVQAVYNTGCLNDINDFISQLKNERDEKSKETAGVAG